MPYANTDIARLLDNLAEMLKLKGEIPFKFRAYRHAAQVIREHPESLETLVQQAAGANAAATTLQRISGIGPAIAGKIVELVTTGRIATYERENAEAPPALRLLLEVPGLDPEQARRIIRELGPNQTLTGLEQAIGAGRLPWLPPTGDGSVAAIQSRLHTESLKKR